MAGALKKTMIYLGLADGDEYDEQPRATERETAPRHEVCLLYTSPSPRDVEESRMPSSA